MKKKHKNAKDSAFITDISLLWILYKTLIFEDAFIVHWKLIKNNSKDQEKKGKKLRVAELTADYKYISN